MPPIAQNKHRLYCIKKYSCTWQYCVFIYRFKIPWNHHVNKKVHGYAIAISSTVDLVLTFSHCFHSRVLFWIVEMEQAPSNKYCCQLWIKYEFNTNVMRKHRHWRSTRGQSLSCRPNRQIFPFIYTKVPQPWQKLVTNHSMSIWSSYNSVTMNSMILNLIFCLCKYLDVWKGRNISCVGAGVQKSLPRHCVQRTCSVIPQIDCKN